MSCNICGEESDRFHYCEWPTAQLSRLREENGQLREQLRLATEALEWIASDDWPEWANMDVARKALARIRGEE